MHLPQPFLENIVRIWGEQGSQWLKDLPDLINLLGAQWRLSSIVPFDNLSFNYVARAYSQYYNKPVVLKIGFPTSEYPNEARALEYYKGSGCVKMLELDRIKSAMIMELIKPGVTTRTFFPVRDVNAVKVACHVMKQLHARPIISSSNFPTMDHWLSLFETLIIPEGLKNHVAKARVIADELKQDTQEQFLLHGDLHHDNILIDEQGSGIAIDPKGVVSERAYEVGAFMCNPEELSQQADLSAIMENRLNLFSKLLSIDKQRLAKASYVRIILSACWTVQANGDWRDDVKFADLIALLGS